MKNYNDPKFIGSFSGQNQFIEALREVDPFIKRKDVIKYLKSDDAYTLHKPIQKPERYTVIDVFTLKALHTFTKSTW